METKTTSAANIVSDYLHECGIFYIATEDGDQAHVRPFGVAEVYEGRLYFMTAKEKNVFRQMTANPKFEVAACKPGGEEWIRITGVLVNDDRREAKAYILDKNPGLKSIYSADDDNTAVLYVAAGEARCFSSSAPEKRISL